jgi:hypothetical protein
MSSDVSWWVWLLGGVATGALPLLGDNRMLGFLQTFLVVCSPFYIFFTVGAKWLPFALFYGGLVVVSSFLFKRRTAREDAERKDSLAAKKKKWG